MKGLIRSAKNFGRGILHPVLRHFYITERIFPEEVARAGIEVKNLRVLLPAQRIEIAPKSDPFVAVGKYYPEGWADRPNVFVCEIPDAYLYVDTGMVCTRHWKVAGDFDVRLTFFKKFGKRRPSPGEIKRIAGTCTTIGYGMESNPYHWMVDCLPKLISLARAEPENKITLIMSDALGDQQRETLAALCPANFELQYHPADSWLQVERLLWPSLVSGVCNAFLPADYYEAIRRPIFARYGLPAVPAKTERLYITRRDSNRRRVLNEDALEAFLQPYGFRTVELSKLSFRQQVELFHRAEIVVGPHGAGLNVLFHCGKIPVVVLHPNPRPQNHYHTLARRLGQDYHFVLHHGDIDSDFEADIPALKRVIQGELGLKR
jgi:capsular polysaccharide biosynthesis protein